MSGMIKIGKVWIVWFVNQLVYQSINSLLKNHFTYIIKFIDREWGLHFQLIEKTVWKYSWCQLCIYWITNIRGLITWSKSWKFITVFFFVIGWDYLSSVVPPIALKIPQIPSICHIPISEKKMGTTRVDVATWRKISNVFTLHTRRSINRSASLKSVS